MVRGKFLPLFPAVNAGEKRLKIAGVWSIHSSTGHPHFEIGVDNVCRNRNNPAALLAAHHLSVSRNSLEQATTRLASKEENPTGSAADDAGSLGVAASLLANIKGADVAKQNANAAIAAVQVADGALVGRKYVAACA